VHHLKSLALKQHRRTSIPTSLRISTLISSTSSYSITLESYQMIPWGRASKSFIDSWLNFNVSTVNATAQGKLQTLGFLQHNSGNTNVVVRRDGPFQFPCFASYIQRLQFIVHSTNPSRLSCVHRRRLMNASSLRHARQHHLNDAVPQTLV
jgi:hypothetical protein